MFEKLEAKKPENYRLAIYLKRGDRIIIDGGDSLIKDFKRLEDCTRSSYSFYEVVTHDRKIGVRINEVTHFELQNPTPPF